MKDFDGAPTAIEVKARSEQIKTKFMAQMEYKPGLPFWQYEEETKILKLAEFESVQDVIEEKNYNKLQCESRITVHRKIKHLPGHLYFQALNKKNAMRKLQNIFNVDGSV